MEMPATGRAVQGCYSIKYKDPTDSDWIYAMDYNWQSDLRDGKTKWTGSESPLGVTHWRTLRVIPDHGLQAILDHFGLTKEDFGMLLFLIYDMSPADLVRIRRAKEQHEGLAYRIIHNMRRGCSHDELFPESFDSKS